MFVNLIYEYPLATNALPHFSTKRGGILFRFIKYKNLNLFSLLLLLHLVNYYLYQISIFTQLCDQQLVFHTHPENIMIASNLGYIIIPVIISVKLIIQTMFIQLPFLVKNKIIAFSNSFLIIVSASFIMLLKDYARLININFFMKDFTVINTLYRIPLGILDLLHINDYSQASFVFLNQLNLFEFFWCAVLYQGLIRLRKLPKLEIAMIVVFLWSMITLFYWICNLYLEMMFS